MKKELHNRFTMPLIGLLILSYYTVLGVSQMKNTNLPETLMFKERELVNLFLLNEKASLTISIYDNNGSEFIFNGILQSHSNIGKETGVLNVSLDNRDFKVKLLVNRKKVNDKMIYNIILINKISNKWYSVDRLNKGYFILSLKDQKQIVNE